jgi:hypothetical protein
MPFVFKVKSPMRRIGIIAMVIVFSLSLSSQAMAACTGGGGDDEGDMVCTPDVGGAESRASVMVVTKIINDNGGNALPSDGLMSYGDGASIVYSWSGIGEPGNLVSVAPGNYVVSGSAISSYERSFSADCSGSVVKDDFKTCIVTYDDVATMSPDCGEYGGGTCPSIPVTDTDGVGGDPAGSNGDQNPGTKPQKDSSEMNELPRTGGASLPMSLAVMAFGVALSLRKRS